MNRLWLLFQAVVLAFLSASHVGGQGPEPPNGPPEPAWEGGPPGPPPAGPGGPMRHPLFVALDQNQDGTICAQEIQQAAEALATLDKNDDGEIGPEELRLPGGRRQSFGGFPGFGQGPDGPGRGQGRRGGRQVPPGAAGRGERGVSPEMMIDRMLERNDLDGDGMLSSEELPERAVRFAEQADANEDGLLDKEELTAGFQQMQERFRPQGGRRGEQPDFRRDRKKDRPRRPPVEEMDDESDDETEA